MEYTNFPEDLLVEILCRLTKKSVARLQCVSKHWLSLISDRNRVFPKTSDAGLVLQTFLPLDFRPKQSSSSSSTDKHITHIISPINFLHVDRAGNAFSSLAPSHILNDDNFFIIASCHGFLLYRKEYMRLSRTLDLVVFHPATNRSWSLSVPEWEGVMLFGMAVDGPHFKFVYLRSPFKGAYAAGPPFILDVFSSENEEWIRKECHLPSVAIPRKRNQSIDSANSLFLDGSFHWIWGTCLVIYHLRKGECRFLKLPQFPNNGGRRKRQDQCIWESEGCVNYCQVSARGGRICIWTLCKGKWNHKKNEYSYRWKPKHTGVLVPPPVAEIKQPPFSFSPFAFNDDFEIVYLMSGRCIFSYNLATKEMKEACTRSPTERRIWRRCERGCHAESREDGSGVGVCERERENGESGNGGRGRMVRAEMRFFVRLLHDSDINRVACNISIVRFRINPHDRTIGRLATVFVHQTDMRTFV